MQFPQIINYDESRVLCLVDVLMMNVIKDNICAEAFKEQFLGLIPSFEFHYKPYYYYSPSITLFKSLIDHWYSKHKTDELKGVRNTDINELIEIIKSKKNDINQYYDDQIAQELRNKKSLEQYILNLTQYYARLLFVRLDLYITKHAATEIAFNEFQQLIALFRNRLSNKDGCFKNLQGYAWALEQGIERGYHCHILLIYDGNKHQNDFGLALKVKQYWKELTNDKGDAFSSNDPRYREKMHRKDQYGLGMVHRDHPNEVRKAILAALYLVNPEKKYQYLRIKFFRTRTFGTGKSISKNRHSIRESKTKV